MSPRPARTSPFRFISVPATYRFAYNTVVFSSLLGTRREDTVFIGDSMETDIIAGLHTEIDTVLVLSGTTSREDLAKYAFRPTYILNGVGDIISATGTEDER